MFDQCRKQWPNIKSTLAQHGEFWRMIFLNLHSKCAVDWQTNEQVDDI